MRKWETGPASLKTQVEGDWQRSKARKGDALAMQSRKAECDEMVGFLVHGHHAT